MTYVIGALLIVVALQAAAIVALLILNARRAHAERTVREREEWFRLLLDRAPVMIWTARPDTTLDYLNSTCAAFTGLPIEKLRDEGLAGYRAEGNGFPAIFNIEADPREEVNVLATNARVIDPYLRVIGEYRKTLEKYPNPRAVNMTDFGRRAPAGVRPQGAGRSGGNWIQTMPGKGWNVILRLYGPWHNKTWKPGDIELVN